ncbi:MAG: AEC family transporter [Verrucomicrobia bacterium]|nr:AEC family transporter [Verrucomicrobiota bacterium]
MHILQVLAPTMLLIAFGAGLAWIKFLGKPFIGQLNKLAFWIALPALVFRAAAHAGTPTLGTLLLIGVITAATILTALLTCGIARGARVAAPARSTFIASAYFGNLAYIGIPILAHSLGRIAVGDAPELLASSVIIMTAMIVINNALSVAIFQGGHFDPLSLARHVLVNPLVIAGSLGILVGASGEPVPHVFDQVLRTLGATAVPLALLCIGGSLEMTPLRGHIPWIAAVSAIKVFAMPLLAWGISRAIGLDPADTRVVLIFSACPTAVVAYTMASQMNGDEALAAGTIAVSTVASFASLAVVLAIT